MRLSAEKNLATVIVWLLSLREKAQTKNRHVDDVSFQENSCCRYEPIFWGCSSWFFAEKMCDKITAFLYNFSLFLIWIFAFLLENNEKVRLFFAANFFVRPRIFFMHKFVLVCGGLETGGLLLEKGTWSKLLSSQLWKQLVDEGGKPINHSKLAATITPKILFRKLFFFNTSSNGISLGLSIVNMNMTTQRSPLRL